MSCPHSVLERVEFAERDCFLYSPDAEHHFDSFYIVGGVVLRVVYLFHIPYQMFCAKIEKTLRISQRGGMESKTQFFISEETPANIVDMNGKTKPLPIILSNLGGS